MQTQRSLQRGFTLVELLVVMTIIGILAAVALPSYLNAVRASHRTDAQMTMQRIAMSLEKFYTTYGKLMNEQGDDYDLASNYGNACVPRTEPCTAESSDVRYFLTLATSATTYTITATPKNGQLSDPCGIMTLDHTNSKTVSGTATSVNECW